MVSVDVVRDWMIDRVCKVFDLSHDRVNGQTTFDDLGIDSLTRAGFAREIERKFNISLDPEVTYEFHTIQKLAEHVASR